MSFSKENMRRVNLEFSGKALRAQQDAQLREQELKAAIPALVPVDEALWTTGLRILDAFRRLRGEELEAEMQRLREENRELQAARKALLEENGYPADYAAVRYECPICSDSGQDGLKMCACKRRRLIMLGYESTGVAHLMETQTFDTFRPDLQPDPRVRETLTKYLKFLRSYAENFDASSRNLLFLGATGLGKTHLSTAIAKVLVEKGCDVVYETAANLFGDFEYERFSRPYSDGGGEGSRTQKYFDCDYLIIDDLGTETSNQFTVSCLYNLLNTRINRGARFLVSTNLGQEELRTRYTDRIYSRLIGECAPLSFRGEDIRRKKLAGT